MTHFSESILKHLADNGGTDGSNIDITDFLRHSYNNSKEEKDLFKLSTILGTIQSKNYILLDYRPHRLGLKNSGILYNFDNTRIFCGLTSMGYDYINESIRQAKMDALIEKQSHSSIETNRSVRDTNKIQKYALGGTLLVTIIACIFQWLTYKMESFNQKAQVKSLEDSLSLIQLQKQQLFNYQEDLHRKIDSLTILINGASTKNTKILSPKIPNK